MTLIKKGINLECLLRMLISNHEQGLTPQDINDYESFIRESGGIVEPTKSELEEYLSEKNVPPSSKSGVLAWWKGNSVKFLILSKWHLIF